MNACTWIKTNKVMYEKNDSGTGEICFTPVITEEKEVRSWCKECKEKTTYFDMQERKIRNDFVDHLTLNHKHCFECSNCQPVYDLVDDGAPLCLPEKCEKCFARPEFCIERFACPKVDMVPKEYRQQ